MRQRQSHTRRRIRSRVSSTREWLLISLLTYTSLPRSIPVCQTGCPKLGKNMISKITVAIYKFIILPVLKRHEDLGIIKKKRKTKVTFRESRTVWLFRFVFAGHKLFKYSNFRGFFCSIWTVHVVNFFFSKDCWVFPRFANLIRSFGENSFWGSSCWLIGPQSLSF